MVDNRNIAPPWQPRFSIGALMLATLVCCVAAAAVSYLVRSGGGRWGVLVFLLITLAGPLVLMVAVSVARAIVEAMNRPRKRKR